MHNPTFHVNIKRVEQFSTFDNAICAGEWNVSDWKKKSWKKVLFFSSFSFQLKVCFIRIICFTARVLHLATIWNWMFVWWDEKPTTCKYQSTTWQISSIEIIGVNLIRACELLSVRVCQLTRRDDLPLWLIAHVRADKWCHFWNSQRLIFSACEMR